MHSPQVFRRKTIVSTRHPPILPRFPVETSSRDSMVLVLTWAASGVDAISYLGMGHVFVANMTGNTVLLGLSLGQGHGMAALRAIVALIAFAVGVAVGAVIVERSPRRSDWPAAVTWAIGVEWVILAFFTLTWHWPGVAPTGAILFVLIALSAVAMGIQSAAIRHLKVPGIATTYITGTLTSMVAGFVVWLHRINILPPPGDAVETDIGRSASAAERKHGARLQAAVFCVYLLAAVASGFLQVRHSPLVTLSPLLAVAFVVINAFVRHRRERAGRPVRVKFLHPDA
jgi:uncharacterized membrane protein YoaK (UPF0700 family)